MKVLQGQATRDALIHSEEMIKLRMEQQRDIESNYNMAK